MRKSLLTILILGLALAGCAKDEAGDAAEQETTLATFAKTEIAVPTIKCGGCVDNIKGGLKEVDGVQSIDVDLDKKIAYVSYDDSKTTVAALEQAIANEGYNANETKRNAEAYADLDKCCQDDAGKH